MLTLKRQARYRRIGNSAEAHSRQERTLLASMHNPRVATTAGGCAFGEGTRPTSRSFRLVYGMRDHGDQDPIETFFAFNELDT
jgi:hypothetical protein